MRIAIASSSLLAIPLVEWAISSSHDFAGIITTPDAPSGRGRSIAPSALAVWATERNISLYKYESETAIEAIHNLAPEIVITLSFGKIVPMHILKLPRYGWLNVHYSALPIWRGAAPVQRAILHGDTSIGLSIFQLDEGMDTGPTFLIKEFPLLDTSTTEERLQYLSEQAALEIETVLSAITNAISPTPQDSAAATYAAKIAPQEGHISWSAPTEEIIRKERALGGNVGIYANLRSQKLSLQGLRRVDGVSSAIPGSIILTGVKNEPLRVAANDGIIEVSHVKPAGKSLMPSQDFLRGARLSDGEVLE